MRKVLFILMTLFIFASCSKDDSWSPEDDINNFIKENPYSVIFENKTDGDLFLKCTGLASQNFGVLKQGKVSETYRGAKPEITVEYAGEGTHYTTVTKKVSLSKEKTVRFPLTYP